MKLSIASIWHHNPSIESSPPYITSIAPILEARSLAPSSVSLADMLQLDDRPSGTYESSINPASKIAVSW